MSDLTAAEKIGRGGEVECDQPMLRFLRIVDHLGLCRTVQADLLGCGRPADLLELIRDPHQCVSDQIALRIEDLERGYQGILAITNVADNILDILFSPLAEPPFFGKPPIRFMVGASASNVRTAADFFCSADGQNAITNGVLAYKL